MPWQAHWGASGEAEDLAAGRSLTCPLTTSAPDLDPSQQGEVKKGDRAQITLPESVTGKWTG